MERHRSAQPHRGHQPAGFGKDSPAGIVVAIVAIGSGNERTRVDDQGAPNPSRSRNSSASRPLTARDANDPMNSKGSTSLASLSSRCASADGSMPSRSARSARRRAASSSSSTTKRVTSISLRPAALVRCATKAPEMRCALATSRSVLVRRVVTFSRRFPGADGHGSIGQVIAGGRQSGRAAAAEQPHTRPLTHQRGESPSSVAGGLPVERGHLSGLEMVSPDGGGRPAFGPRARGCATMAE